MQKYLRLEGGTENGVNTSEWMYALGQLAAECLLMSPASLDGPFLTHGNKRMV